MRDRQQVVDLYPVCLRFATDILVENERAVHEGEFMIVDIRQPTEFAKKLSRFYRQVPRQRGRDDRSLFHRCVGFSGGRVDTGIEHHITTRKWIDRRGRVQLYRTLQHAEPARLATARLL